MNVKPRNVRSVLIVDDDLLFANACLRVLASQGRRVVIATDFEAIGHVARAASPDVALVDLVLDPERFAAHSGLEVVGEIKEYSPDTIIVLVSGALSDAAALEAGRAGAHGVERKPFRCDDLIRRIENGESTREYRSYSLENVVYEHIQRTLREANGNVTRAAKLLGIPRQSLQRRLRKHPPRA